MENTALQKISFLVLRIMGSLIFIMAGFNHLLLTAGAAARLEKAPFAHLASWIAPAETLIILSGVGLLIGGSMLLAGFKTRLAAALLLGILIPITLTVQVGAEGSGPLFKNIALIGMLMFFIVNGAVHYGLDQTFFRNKQISSTLKNKLSRNYVAVLAVGLLMFLGSCATGMTAAHNTTAPKAIAAETGKKYAVLISQPNHLKAAVNTAETITKESRYQRESFVVMACGKSVEAFVKGSSMAQELEKGKAAGITYRVCGMSLKQFNIDASTLIEGVEVIPNGLTYMFDLQQQGYKTVEL
ncbi:DoxX family membrane protein [Pontibacter sp. HSC-36F09]|uniref:DoxX family membrane protein n=1 Tax=Pontibacter sp. HSC-36F09 TaxID=2910966 RepID=UPI0020A10BFD|nr:DoxX family membrane protein [Pontibacter sp. HSC-36F09]MCP2044307.1 putative oxidoreductase [Pontibacter sp. HSC-36F09]